MDTHSKHPKAPGTSVTRAFTAHWPETPCWTPLEALFEPDTLRHFMAIGEVVQDGIRICLYKHRQTRRYLNLNLTGGAYRFEGSRYSPMKLGPAIIHALS
jgi:hypothetical protein